MFNGIKKIVGIENSEFLAEALNKHNRSCQMTDTVDIPNTKEMKKRKLGDAICEYSTKMK